MKFLITGATGMVGQKLIEVLMTSGHDQIAILTRNKKRALENSPFPVKAYEWDPAKNEIDQKALENVDIVVHLAGESVADGRWTEAKKARILKSRVDGTKTLIQAIEKSAKPPKKLISASAIGIYGDRGEESLNAESKLGDSFLADVCKQWEQLAHDHSISQMQSISIRIGIVLSSQGGALKKMLPPFKAGIAGKLGSGNQYMSWIHIDDLVGQIIYLAEKESKYTVYNGVSPKPIANHIFTQILGHELKRPTLIPVPTMAIKILFGEMSEILLASQKVIPTRFIEEGYQYKFESLKDALRDILKYNIAGEEVLKKYQWINSPPDKVFHFFSNEKNLEKITPKNLNFEVMGKTTPNIQKGTIISYKLKLRGIPLKWKSKISEFVKEQYFVDEQISGPYKKWIHTHSFHSLGNGTLMKDLVVYKVPMGVLGKLFAGYFIKKDLTRIFNYRKKIIQENFKAIQ